MALALAGRPSGCSIRRCAGHRLRPPSQSSDQVEFPAGNNGPDDLSCRYPPARRDVSVRKVSLGGIAGLGSDMKGSVIGVAKVLGAACLSCARIGRNTVGGAASGGALTSGCCQPRKVPIKRSSPRGTMGQMTCRAAIHRREGKYLFETNRWASLLGLART